MHDLIIRNGLIVDGTGGEPYHADVAIDGDKIVVIGDVADQGKTEIDATGHIVTPGFVDLHTHLDAQIGWDPMLTPSSWHGVTTAILGNCGVTFAPCKPGDPEFLAGMMETVEDIPKSAILEGLSWNWEHYGEYLDELESLNPAINVTGLVGHCALRYYVMGERSIDEQATADEKQQIAALARDAVKAGAVGFSTSRNPGHRIPDGRSVPGTYAEDDELVEIAKAVGAEGGLMQTVMNMSEFETEMALLKKEAAEARVLFSHYTGRTSSYGDKVEAKVMAMCNEGLDVNAMVIPRGSGFVTGLQAYLPWHGGPWEELSEMAF
ncbi:MAG: amidohydrolase family protein, partial [Pseudomonadota bacterium]